MATEISNSDDIIDSRDVIARIQELEDFLDSEGLMNTDRLEELHTLKSLVEQAEGYAVDWHHGETLIRDSYFVRYAQELADDTGAVPDGASWPNNCIDWEQAAQELRMDYTAVDFDGVTYWIR